MIDLLIKWGSLPNQNEIEMTSVAEFLMGEYAIAPRFCYNARADLMRRYNPDVTDDNLLSFVPQAGAKRISGKPGRMLRKMFPNLTDPDVEHLNNKLKNGFMFDTSTWTFNETSTEIGYVYQLPESDAVSMATSDDCKELCCSCMRHEFEHLDFHPCSAYNSGDFTLYYVLNDDQELLARTLVYDANETRGPVYATSERARSFLLEHLPSRVKLGEYGSWIGARLRFLGQHDCGVIGPYLDLTPKRLTWEPGDDYMVISSGGNVDGADHEGVLECEIYECCGCDHTQTQPFDDYHGYCDSCAEDMPTCGVCDDTIYPHHNPREVLRPNGDIDDVCSCHPTMRNENNDLVLVCEIEEFENE